MKPILTILTSLLFLVSYAQVGINKENPEATLDVKQKNQNITKILQVSDAKEHHLLTISSNGKVDIGEENTTSTLNVNGYIKLGTADTNADSKPQLGMIRFNAKTEKFQGYTKKGWVDLN